MQVERFKGGEDEISEGSLECSCGRVFPIIGGIPRMLPDKLRANLARYHPEYAERYPQVLPRSADHPASPREAGDERETARTLRFYSFLHPRLIAPVVTEELRRFWASAFASRIRAEPGFFADKVGLDAGCGEGRYSWHVAKQGAEVIAMDLSEGVNVAHQNCADLGRVHAVQGSIYSLPIRDRCLDFAFSTGVLHHLPDPRAGFQELVPALRAGGRVMIWVYGLEQMNVTYRLSHLTFLRSVGSRLDPLASFALSAGVAAALNVGVWLPTRFLAAVGLEGRLPTQLLETSRLPFVWKLKEVQDRIGVPVTHYLSRDDLEEWFESAGLARVEISNTNGRGWFASGFRDDR
jgi:SAM-dependent methyltransferase